MLHLTLFMYMYVDELIAICIAGTNSVDSYMQIRIPWSRSVSIISYQCNVQWRHWRACVWTACSAPGLVWFESICGSSVGTHSHLIFEAVMSTVCSTDVLHGKGGPKHFGQLPHRNFEKSYVTWSWFLVNIWYDIHVRCYNAVLPETTMIYSSFCRMLFYCASCAELYLFIAVRNFRTRKVALNRLESFRTEYGLNAHPDR